MTKYEKMKNMEECFIKTALRAENPSFKIMWYGKAADVDARIKKMTIEEAQEVVND